MTVLDPILVSVVLIMAFSAFIQSLSGFGMALVAVAALPLVIEVEQAIALIAIANLFVSAYTFWLHRHEFSWRAARPLVIGMIIGIPAGFYFMHSLKSEALIHVLGIVLILIGLYDLLYGRMREVSLPEWAGWPAGILGGALGGAFNIGGVPIAVYVYSQPWTKSRTVGVLGATFLAAGITRNALMGPAGDYTRPVVEMALWTILPMGLGIYLGKKALHVVPKEKLRLGVFLFVLVMGVKYAFG